MTSSFENQNFEPPDADAPFLRGDLARAADGFSPPPRLAGESREGVTLERVERRDGVLEAGARAGDLARAGERAGDLRAGGMICVRR